MIRMLVLMFGKHKIDRLDFSMSVKWRNHHFLPEFLHVMENAKIGKRHIVFFGIVVKLTVFGIFEVLPDFQHEFLKSDSDG